MFSKLWHRSVGFQLWRRLRLVSRDFGGARHSTALSSLFSPRIGFDVIFCSLLCFFFVSPHLSNTLHFHFIRFVPTCFFMHETHLQLLPRSLSPWIPALSPLQKSCHYFRRSKFRNEHFVVSRSKRMLSKVASWIRRMSGHLYKVQKYHPSLNFHFPFNTQIKLSEKSNNIPCVWMSELPRLRTIPTKLRCAVHLQGCILKEQTDQKKNMLDLVFCIAPNV